MSQPFLFSGADLPASATLLHSPEIWNGIFPLRSVFQQEMWISLFTTRSRRRPAWLSPLCYMGWAVHVRGKCTAIEDDRTAEC